MRNRFSLAISLTVFIAVFGGMMPSASKAEAAAQLILPSQPLSDSLWAVGNRWNINILFSPDQVAGMTAPAFSGATTIEQALESLLAGTRLKYRFIDERTVSLVAAALTSEVRKDQELRLTQSESAPAQPVEAVGGADEKSSASIQEIIVTAQKRAERLQDVPISIVALSADDLQKRKIASVDDLAMVVPGLSIQSSGGFQRRIMLRGISNIFGSSSLIGMYLDEASVTSGSDLQLDLRTYDLERVEVLRGPQGTLYGEGSVGGTIRFLTRNPRLDDFAMRADIAAMFTEDGGPSQRLETAVNVPLVDNELGLRIAGTFDHQGGWIDQPAAGQKDFNEQNGSDIRLKGLWQPTAQFTVNIMALVHRNDISTNTGENADGNYIQGFNQTTTPQMTDDYDLYNATLTYDFSQVRLLSTTSYIEQDKVQRNFGYRLVILNPATSPPYDVLKTLYERYTDLFSEELRLTSSTASPLQWTIGGFYRHSLIEDNNIFYFGFPGLPGTPLPALTLSPRKTDSDSGAIFGDVSYRLSPRLTLGTGLRYFEEKQDFTNATGILQAGKFHALTPRMYAEVKVTDQVNTYASAAKGFRSGGFNNLNRPSYGPENVWTYELGTKMSLLNGTLSTEAAIYYSDYKDYQISGTVVIPTGAFNITSNAGNARIKGVEWGFTWLPADQWSLSFNGNYVKTEFYKISATNSSYAVGDPVDLFPKYGYTLSAQRNFTWAGKPGFARLDYNEQGPSTYRNRTNGPWYYSESDLINMLNLNLNMQWNGSLSIGVFAQNLLNDRGFTDSLVIDEAASRARPRTVGVGFGVTF